MYSFQVQLHVLKIHLEAPPGLASVKRRRSTRRVATDRGDRCDKIDATQKLTDGETLVQSSELTDAVKLTQNASTG